MNIQPEPLRLAVDLDEASEDHDAWNKRLNYEAAIELRRLHQEVEELSSENIRLQNLVKDLSDWNDKLKERLRFRFPLTHEQRLDVLTEFEKHRMKWDDMAVLIDLVEVAHGIYKEEN